MTPSLPVELDTQKYAIVWRFMPTGWADIPCDGTPPGAIPFFLEEELLEQLSSGSRPRLSPFMMLCGILYSGLGDDNYVARCDPAALHTFLTAQVERLRKVLRPEAATETILLDAAATVRERYGVWPSSRVLSGAHQLLPGSSAIRADLIQDLWMVLELSDNVEKEPVLEQIDILFRAIRFLDIQPEAIGLLVYMFAAALSMLGKTERREEVRARLVPRYVNTSLRSKLDRLAESSPPRFDDCRLWTQGRGSG